MSDNAMTVVCRSLADPAMQEKFQSVLPPGISLDRFTRVTLTAIQQNPAILDADRQSLYNACVIAATRGLLPDNREGALTIFNTKVGDQWVKKAQFMPMVEGIIKELATAGIKAHAVSVYANDKVEVWNDDEGQHFKHTPVLFGDRGNRVGAVAWAKDASGRTYVEAINMDDAKAIRARSRSKDKDGNPTGPWRDAPDRMEQKSALHRLRKRIAIIGNDTVLAKLREDEENSDYETSEEAPPQEAAKDEPPKKSVPETRPRGLRAVIQQAAAPEPPPVRDEPPGFEGAEDADLF